MQAVASLFGRLMIATIFLMSAIGNKIPNFKSVATYMASEGVPFPELMLAGAIVFLIAGSLSVIAGFKIHLGAALLLCSQPTSSMTSGSLKVRNNRCR
ncbi:MAG: DoxX family protein [Fuerstiella sp.]|jgi:putative oxidoreductase